MQGMDDTADLGQRGKVPLLTNSLAEGLSDHTAALGSMLHTAVSTN